jgi:hypothetical protein
MVEGDPSEVGVGAESEGESPSSFAGYFKSCVFLGILPYLKYINIVSFTAICGCDPLRLCRISVRVYLVGLMGFSLASSSSSSDEESLPAFFFSF